MRSRGDADRLGGQVETVGIRRVHPPIDVQQRHARAVYRNLDLLGRFGGVQGRAAVAIQRARRLVIERHPEPVVTVRRKRVLDRGAATGAERRTVHLLALRHPAGHVEGDLPGRSARVAHGQAADFGGRGEIGLHQRRREQLRVGDVVEVRALGVERQVLAGIDVEREQVADRLGVLRAVQPLEGAAARRRRVGLVHLRLERGRKVGQHVRLRTAGAGRRHLAGAQLANHLLGGLAVRRRVLDRVPFEREVSGPRPVAVAADAGAGHDRLR